MTPESLGPFDIEKQLGVGGMGIVYLAVYRDTGQKVALKLLSPAFSADHKLISRFEREIGILKKLEHPNIVRYFGGGKKGDQRYYAMEYMDGGSLDAVLERKGQLSWEQTVRIGMQLSAALEHAHNNGIIHRDLKPGNLFISRKGRLRLGDFGIARDNDATALTAAGKTVGTYAYMAPEQIHGKYPIGPRTDIYAMGCLMFQFLAGRVPFEGDNAAEMFMKHLKDDPGSVCEYNLDCPIWLDRVIQRMLQKEPEDRPFDALAVQQLLSDVRDRVAEQVGMAGQAMTSAMDTVVTDQERTELHKVLGPRKKKKKKKKVPFWERTSFLLACLTAVIALVTWLAWPMSESDLFAAINTKMRDKSNWIMIQDAEIAEYLERFPSGAHISEVREFNDTIDMNRAEEQALSRAKRQRPPRSEAERAFMEARKYQEFGDNISALKLYEGLVQLFSDKEEERPFVNLAKRAIRRIQEQPPAENQRLVLILESLAKARDAAVNGRAVEARQIWSSIVNLYQGNQEFQRHVQYAQACLAGDGVPPPFEGGPGADPNPAPEAGGSD